MTHFCVLCPQKIQLLQRVTGRIVTSKQMACVTCNQQHNSVWHDISKRATPLLLLFVVKPIAKCYFQLMCEMDSFSQGNNIFALNATTMVFTTHTLNTLCPSDKLATAAGGCCQPNVVGLIWTDVFLCHGMIQFTSSLSMRRVLFLLLF